MLPPNENASDLPPIGRQYEVAGRRFYLHQSGEGGPPIVFLPGAGMFGLGYLNVQREAAKLSTSIVYDRAGTGWSDPIDLPRSARAVVEELRSLLQVAAIPGPYLFVGHSLGGLYARRFAQLYPDLVAGLLLLDPANEDYSAHLSEEARQKEAEAKRQPMPDISPEQIEAYRPILTQLYAGWPTEIRGPLIERHLHPIRALTGFHEGRNIDELYDEVRSGGPIPSVPVIVYTAMGIDDSQRFFSTEETIRAQNQAKLGAATAFARSTPGAENRVLDDASHAMMHVQRPDAVVLGLEDLLAPAKSLR